jgi:hypothetical protein
MVVRTARLRLEFGHLSRSDSGRGGEGRLDRSVCEPPALLKPDEPVCRAKNCVQMHRGATLLGIGAEGVVNLGAVSVEISHHVTNEVLGFEIGWPAFEGAEHCIAAHVMFAHSVPDTIQRETIRETNIVPRVKRAQRPYYEVSAVGFGQNTIQRIPLSCT